jgi:hypothetical protein
VWDRDRGDGVLGDDGEGRGTESGVAARDLAIPPSPKVSSSSWGDMLTERDLASNLFLRCSNRSGSCSAVSRPSSPFLTGVSSIVRERVGNAETGVVGMPGEVGGRAKGAELIEWAPRLWEWGADLVGAGSEVLVLVKVMVTENDSPAK